MRIALLGLTVLALVGCGGRINVVRARAAADLQCDGYIFVQPMPGAAYHASGCGRRVSYVCGPSLCVREGEVRVDEGAVSEPTAVAAASDDAAASAALHAHPELVAVASRVRA
ncbi:MAG: hypothetical protein IT378_12495, partial [Sandaracinaceae bacterium]|nr:hypothetical protein [Sandaracinaceae bacterium]